jgi:hypothetical protein
VSSKPEELAVMNVMNIMGNGRGTTNEHERARKAATASIRVISYAFVVSAFDVIMFITFITANPPFVMAV